MSFWENYKKALKEEFGIKEIKKKKFIILVVVLLLIGTGIWWYQHQKDVNFCKDICVYIPGGETWKISVGGRWLAQKYDTSKYFPEQEQCIDYCLRNK